MNANRTGVAVLLALLAGGAIGFGQQPGGAPAGNLKFERVEHDFGKIRDDAPVADATFKFSNVGSAAITLKALTLQCSCAAGKFARPLPYAVAPGESGEIVVSFNPLGRSGKDRKTVAVETDDPAAPKVELAIVAEVVARIRIEPRALYLGEFARGVAGEPKRVTVTARFDENPFKSATVDDPSFDWKRVEAKETSVDGEKAWQETYEVTFKGAPNFGRIQAKAQILCHEKAKMQPQFVPIIADVVGDLRVVPDQLNLRLDGSGKPWSQDILFQSRSQTPFTISAVTVEGDADLKLVVEHEPDPRMPATYRIKVSGANPSRAANAATITGVVKIRSDVKDQNEFVVPIKGFVTPTAPAQGGAGK